MKYRQLTLEEVVQLHVLVLDQSGGSSGIRDVGRLHSAIATQDQQVFGEQLYKTIYEKAAALIRGIIGDHPFSDGNKRTAMLSGITLLELNGCHFHAREHQIEDFAVAVAVDHLEISVIAEWLECHTEKVT